MINHILALIGHQYDSIIDKYKMFPEMEKHNYER